MREGSPKPHQPEHPQRRHRFGFIPEMKRESTAPLGGSAEPSPDMLERAAPIHANIAIAVTSELAWSAREPQAEERERLNLLRLEKGQLIERILQLDGKTYTEIQAAVHANPNYYRALIIVIEALGLNARLHGSGTSEKKT